MTESIYRNYVFEYRNDVGTECHSIFAAYDELDALKDFQAGRDNDRIPANVFANMIRGLRLTEAVEVFNTVYSVQIVGVHSIADTLYWEESKGVVEE